MRFKEPAPDALSGPVAADAVTSIVWSPWASPKLRVSTGAVATPPVLTTSDDGSISTWQSDGQHVATTTGVLESATSGTAYGVLDAHVNPSAPECVAWAGSDGTVRVWNRVFQRVDAAIPASSAPGIAITAVRWSPAGDAFATGSENGAVVVWNATGEPLCTVNAEGGISGSTSTTRVDASVANGMAGPALVFPSVYALRWAADGASLLVAAGATLSIRALPALGSYAAATVAAPSGARAAAATGGSRAPPRVLSGGSGAPGGLAPPQPPWRAHGGCAVVAADWSHAQDTVLSGGEDGT